MHCEVIRFCWAHHVKSAQIFLGEWECERVLLRAGLLEPGRAGRHVVLGVRPRHGLVLRAGPARAHSPLGRAVLVSGQKTGFRAASCMDIYSNSSRHQATRGEVGVALDVWHDRAGVQPLLLPEIV